MATIEIIAIAFCCFLLLTLALGVGCVYMMFDHNQGVCVPVKSIDRKCVTEFFMRCSDISTYHFFRSSRPHQYIKVSFLFMDIRKFIVL